MNENIGKLMIIFSLVFFLFIVFPIGLSLAEADHSLIKVDESTIWIILNPDTNPPPREYPCVAYVEESDKIYLFGGLSDPGDPHEIGEPLYDFWTYDHDSNTWQNLSSTSFSRYDASMAYDSESNILLLFGGSPDFWSMSRRDIFWYDTVQAKWYNITSETDGPSARQGAA